MPGYVYRPPTRPIMRGFNEWCGTDKGVDTHNQRDEELCDTCEAHYYRHSKAPARGPVLYPNVPRTQSDKKRERGTCGRCGGDLARGSLPRHKRLKPECANAGFVEARK